MKNTSRIMPDNSQLPSLPSLYRPILELLSDNKVYTTSQILDSIVRSFDIGTTLLEKRYKGRKKPILQDNIEKACSNMRLAGLINYTDSPTQRQINDTGREFLSKSDKDLIRYINKHKDDPQKIGEEFDPGITVDRWTEILHKTGVLDDDDIVLIRRMVELGNDVDLTTVKLIPNSDCNDYYKHLVDIGKRVSKAYNIDVPLMDGDPIFWLIPCTGTSKKGRKNGEKYLFSIRPELKNAISHNETNESEQTDRQTDKDFFDFLSKKKLQYDTATVENFLLSLKAKRFVILTGGTGTGKTKLAKSYGQFLQCINNSNNETNPKFYEVIAVGSNWNDRRHILGYQNAITGQYSRTVALDLMIKASNDEDNAYLLILDEMNLSHVERYFSDILSCMESGEDLILNSESPDVPNRLKLKDNLFIIGTVNIDETTYSFSPKVLDRANVIEIGMSDYGTGEMKDGNPVLDYILGNGFKYNPEGDRTFLQDCMTNGKCRTKNASDMIKEMLSVPENESIVKDMAYALESMFKIMNEMNLPFGYRTIDEIVRFLYVAWIYKEKGVFENWETYLDAQIIQKILPKIHGNRSISEPLKNLKGSCVNEENNYRFKRSECKLQRMINVLDSQNYVSFHS